LKIKTKNVSSHTADSKPVKQEVNGTVILPPFVFPASPPKKPKQVQPDLIYKELGVHGDHDPDIVGGV
jgi:hypothetical protein